MAQATSDPADGAEPPAATGIEVDHAMVRAVQVQFDDLAEISAYAAVPTQGETPLADVLARLVGALGTPRRRIDSLGRQSNR